ncbi:glycosyltransferase family 2 protein [bacterium]|nr:glycosyltransferase family 2 protein [bacterium]
MKRDMTHLVPGPPGDAVVIVPAFNEEGCIVSVLKEIREHQPDLDILVVNDGSADRTSVLARENGAVVLDLPYNLGVGDAVQAGLIYAFEKGYRYAVRCDGDGQHSPSDIEKLLSPLREEKADLVIGSRFLGKQLYEGTFVRTVGITCLSWFLSAICRKRVTDPTSGFQAFNRPTIYFFSRSYPKDYPEPEALALMRRQGYDYIEVPAVFRDRMAGSSTIGSWATMYYAIKVFLALLVDRARPVDVRYERWNVVTRI